MTTPKTVEDYNDVILLYDITWLGEEIPENTNTKTKWKCVKGHLFMSTYSRIRRGYGCSTCTGKPRKTKADYNNLAKQRNLKWIGTEIKSVRAKTAWICAKGHTWVTSYSNIEKSDMCYFCYQEGRRKVTKDYHDLAIKYGFEWLGPEVPNTYIKTNWKCSKGHLLNVTYTAINSSKKCGVCKKRDTEDFKALASTKGFIYLGGGIGITKTKPKWKCTRGHTFIYSYREMEKRTHCPICYTLQRKPSSEKYHCLAKEKGFSWIGVAATHIKLKTTWECEAGHQWEASYNSIKSGKGCLICYKNNNKVLPVQYTNLAHASGFTWLGPEVFTTTTKTKWQCNRDHIWEATYADIKSNGTRCPHCYGNKIKTKEDYHALAKEKDFIWIESDIVNIRFHTKWKCSKGHILKTSYASFKKSSKCPQCKKNYKVSEDYSNLGTGRNIMWVGETIPQNTGTRTLWECSEGHQWEARYNNIKAGTGCPQCYRVKQKTRVGFNRNKLKPRIIPKISKNTIKPLSKRKPINKPKNRPKIKVKVKRGLSSVEAFRLSRERRLKEIELEKQMEQDLKQNLNTRDIGEW